MLVSLHHLMKWARRAIAKTLPISLQSYEMPCQKGAALALDCRRKFILDLLVFLTRVVTG